MPYSKNDYPDTIKNLPAHAREIWIAAYNAAYDEYDKDETKAVSTAWAAVKKQYHKADDKWIVNEVKDMSKIETIRQQLEEVGKRNNSEDSVKLKEILKLVSELLGDVAVVGTNESIQGSYEEKKEKVLLALRAVKGNDYYIDSLFDTSIIFSSWKDDRYKCYQADYTEHEGDYVISNIQEVELITIIKKINESLNKIGTVAEKKLEDIKSKKQEKNEARKPHQINEVLTLRDYEILEEQKDNKGKITSLKIRVPVAQKADVINENNRKYPSQVLRESVAQQKQLAELNSLTMYDTHPKNNSGTVASIIGKIQSLSFNENTQTISLDEVVFIPTSTGSDCMEVIKAGIPLQVSQRGEGTSHIEHINGKPIEIVESQQVYGYDLLPPGMAGVQDKGNAVEILESKKEMINMELTQEQLDEMINTKVGSLMEAKQSGLDEQQKEISKILTENKAMKAVDENKQAVQARIANSDFKFGRFAETQKKIILEGLDYAGTLDQVNARLDEKIAMMDSAIASAKLEAKMGGQSTGYGATRIEVGDTAIPGAERIAKLNEATRTYLGMSESLPLKLPAMLESHKKAVMDEFVRRNYATLVNEADTMGASNLPTVTQYSAVVIEQAFQMLTAFPLCDLGMMAGSPTDLFLENYSEAPNSDINALKVTQGGTIAKTAMTLTNFKIYSELLALRIGLYEQALTAAKSAGNYDLEARSIGAMAKDFSRRKDRYIYGLMLAKSDCYETGAVTSAETLTQIGTTTKWYSVCGGANYQNNPTNVVAKANRHFAWVKNEFVKKFDAAGNLASTYIALAGTDATSTLQKVEVKDSSATPKTLVFGFLQADGSVRVTENDITSALADYYVLYADGAIVISDAPVTPGLTAPFKAKYTYTKNARVWMMTPPSGVTFENHLAELHQLTGQVKAQLLGSRFWTPNYLASSITTADMISNSKLYQQAGSNAANTIATDGWIERFAGLEPTKSAIIPDERMIVGVKGAIAVRNHIPYRIEGPIRTSGVAGSEYQGLETEGIDCPIASKLATLAIGQ